MSINKNIDELYKILEPRKFIYTVDELKEKIYFGIKNYQFTDFIATNNYSKLKVIPEIEINDFELWIEEHNSLQKIFEDLYQKGVFSVVIKFNCELSVDIYSEIEKGVNNVPIQLIVNKFIKDDLQIYEMKSVGVSSIIFNINKYKIPDLKKYVQICEEVNLHPLTICENKKEIGISLNLDLKYISIANSTIKKNIDLNNSQILRREIPNKIVTIGCGNIRTPNQLKQLNSIGFDAAIVNFEYLDKLLI